MRLTLQERQSLTRVIATRYRRARKKEKKEILNEFLHSTGYNRKYAAYVLRMYGKRIRVRNDTVIEAYVRRRNKRKRLRIKNRSRTKPGTLLKHQIPIRTFSEWDEGKPGFIEIDLVGHDGGDASGDYTQSLNCVDVCTDWTETFAVKNKAQIWVFEGIEDMRVRLPFDLLGIDSDNGSERLKLQKLYDSRS